MTVYFSGTEITFWFESFRYPFILKLMAVDARKERPVTFTSKLMHKGITINIYYANLTMKSLP